MPGAKQNQAKKTLSQMNMGIKMNPTPEEAQALLNKCFACVMIHMNGMEKTFEGCETQEFMEWKSFLVGEIKKACEPEGWEHNGSVAFAWKVLDCECQKSKIISITDGEQHDTGVMIQFICRNIPREETRFNLRVVEGKLKAKYGDKFNLGAGRKCGNDDCDSIHTFPHVLGILDGALMGHLENLEKLEELKKELAGNAEEIEALEDDLSNAEKELEELKKELAGWEEQIESGHLECSENVLCSYDDVNDFIWNRVKDICREDIPPKYQPLFDGNQFIRGFKGMPELKKENEELKSRVVDYEYILKENEELKAKLARCEEKNKVCCEENATLFLNQKVSRRKNQKPRVFIADCPPMPEINTEGPVRRFQVVAGGAEAVCADKPEE
jgi:hypothetical protein